MKHETVSFTTKLGTTRAGERTRIWIEGKRLIAAGFNVGDQFDKQWSKGKLTLIGLLDNPPPAKHGTRGTVSGKGEKPIIDITGALVAQTFKGTHVKVTYCTDVIVITNHVEG